VRGEHLVAQNPGVDDFFVEEPRSDEWISLFPHGERIVLGGNAREDDWSLDPDPASARAILDRCARVEPRLIDARVIEQQVGLRPVRSAVRVEREKLAEATIIHNYGHGASGVSLSWGCANAVVALAQWAQADARSKGSPSSPIRRPIGLCGREIIGGQCVGCSCSRTA
jgi:D-amino-acid oxidase